MTENEFIKKHLGLAKHICNRRAKNQEQYEEYYSAALYALMVASRNFNKTKGYQFSTYAERIIENEINRILYTEKRLKRTADNPRNKTSFDWLIRPHDHSDDFWGRSQTSGDLMRDETVNVEEEAISNIEKDRLRRFIETVKVNPRHKQAALMILDLDMSIHKVAKVLGVHPFSIQYGLRLIAAKYNKFEEGEKFNARLRQVSRHANITKQTTHS